MDMKRCGALLKELRRENKFTQEQLAERLGVSSRSVSRWETGANLPDLDTLLCLADLYAVDVRELIEGERSGAKKAALQQAEAFAEYSRTREEFLLRRVLLGILCGGAAWALSLVTMLRFTPVVMAAEWIAANAFFFAAIYLICALHTKARRSADGCLAILNGLFFALTAANALLLLLFFGSGRYINYGLRGLVFVTFAFLAGFLGAGAFLVFMRKKHRTPKRSFPRRCD